MGKLLLGWFIYQGSELNYRDFLTDRNNLKPLVVTLRIILHFDNQQRHTMPRTNQ